MMPPLKYFEAPGTDIIASAIRPPVQLSAVASVCSRSHRSWLISLLIILLSNSMT